MNRKSFEIRSILIKYFKMSWIEVLNYSINIPENLDLPCIVGYEKEKNNNLKTYG